MAIDSVVMAFIVNGDKVFSYRLKEIQVTYTLTIISSLVVGKMGEIKSIIIVEGETNRGILTSSISAVKILWNSTKHTL